MKNLYTALILVSTFGIHGITHALPIQPDYDYSQTTRMGYEADGLDEWDLPENTSWDDALASFTTKCFTEIPARIQDRFQQTELRTEDFNFTSSIKKYFIRGWGKSYRCVIDVTVKDSQKYHFTRWLSSEFYYPYFDQNTGKVVTAVDQCKKETARLDSIVEEMKLFDRHSLLYWADGTDPVTGKPMTVETCHVVYIKVCKPFDQNCH